MSRTPCPARTLTALVVLLLAALPTACGSPVDRPPAGPISSEPPPASPPSSGSGGPEPQPDPASTAGDADSETEKLVLRRQIEFQVGGDGLLLTCRPDDESWREPPPPAIWMNTLTSASEYPGDVVLCLRGFEIGRPVHLTAQVGSIRQTAEVTPVDGPPVFDQNFLYEVLPSETLFDARAFQVYRKVSEDQPVDDSDDGLLVSDSWVFLPTATVRDALSVSGGFAMTARQDATSASTQQPVARPQTPTFQVLERTGTARARRIVVFGFTPGTSLPIGLYRRAERDSQRATLVETLSTITVPGSRIAELALDDYLRTAEPGWYCVAPPVKRETSCEGVVMWPPFPGTVSEGDNGDAVRDWQQILIQAGLITDRKANHDGSFGPATAKAVRSYLSELSNPDGVNTLGPKMYELITG